MRRQINALNAVLNWKVREVFRNIPERMVFLCDFTHKQEQNSRRQNGELKVVLNDLLLYNLISGLEM